MASPLIWKVYDGGVFIAATRHARDAAIIANLNAYPDARIKSGRVVYNKRKDNVRGVDPIANLCERNASQHARDRWRGPGAPY